MKISIHSLMFFLLVQVLTPFVLISGVISQAKDGMLLVCTSDGYQWVQVSGSSKPSESSNSEKSRPNCPLCLIDFDLGTNYLGVIVRHELAIDIDLNFFEEQDTYGYLEKSISSRLVLLYDVLGRAPPVDLIS